MDADNLTSRISSARHLDAKARVRWAHQRARRSIANLDREPFSPNAPDASPVEAKVRRFG